MTARRDPDRILDAWLDLMPSEAPDRAIEAVLQAVETAPQVRRSVLGGARRSTTMTRLILIAATALLGAALLGGALLGGVGRPSALSDVPSPTPAPQSTEAPLIGGLGEGMGYATTAPDQLASTTWVAELPAIPGITDTPQVAGLRFTADGTTPSLDTTGGIVTLGRVISGLPRYLGIGSALASASCAKGDYGIYRPVEAADRVHLDLRVEPRSAAAGATPDTCAARAEALGRIWARSLVGSSTGGQGVLPIADGAVWFTLPDGAWNGRTSRETATVEGATRTLFVAHDPAGFTDPCGPEGGDQLDIARGRDAFLAYLGTLPGFTVQTESITLAGQPATRVTIPTTRTPDCPSGKVWEWRGRGEPGGWFLGQGDTDVLYLVERDDGLWLLQWLGGGVTREEELGVLSTVAFTSSLLEAPLP